MPKVCQTIVVESRILTETVVALRIDAKDIVENASAGQFVHIKCGEGSVLRRPISICDVRDGYLTTVVEARGAGTRWLTERKPGDSLDIIGPLGKGFDLSGKNIILLGGGIGVPPMLFAATSSPGKSTAVLGFRSKSAVILQQEFQQACQEVYITTDDGSYGERGQVSQPLRRLLESGGYDAVLACGPRAMLKAAAGLSQEYGVACQVSLEERMGCGIGACLVCACKTQKNGQEKMSHVCKDGPVFRAEEVLW